MDNSDHIQNNNDSDIRMEIDMRNIDRNDCESEVQVQLRDNFQDEGRNDEHDIMHAYDNYIMREFEEDVDDDQYSQADSHRVHNHNDDSSDDNIDDSEHESSDESDDSSSDSRHGDVEQDVPFLSMADLEHPVTFKAQVTAKERLLKVIALAMKHHETPLMKPLWQR